jgi:hypothetical protein
VRNGARREGSLRAPYRTASISSSLHGASTGEFSDLAFLKRTVENGEFVDATDQTPGPNPRLIRIAVQTAHKETVEFQAGVADRLAADWLSILEQRQLSALSDSCDVMPAPGT